MPPLPAVPSPSRPGAQPGEDEMVSLKLPDADIDTVLSALEIYTGKIILRPAQLPTAGRVVEPEQTKERIVRAPKPIATDRLLIGYKAPGQDDADWAALEIVSTLLAGCPSARLHRKLVIEKEAASSVDAQLTPFSDPSLLRLAVTTARGHSADEIIATIDAEIKSLIENPPTANEVEKAKALAETDFWSSLVDVDGKAEALGHYETALGDFRRVNVIAERLT